MNTKPKVIGYIPLHYGSEYLHYTIKSMEPFVEKIWIVYSPEGSQGHRTNVICPEEEGALMDIALKASQKVHWHKGTWTSESAHRRWILSESEGYDLIFTLDSDEIVEPNDIESALQKAFESDKRFFGIHGFVNFWKSFNWCCRDGFMPIRITNLRNKEGQENVDCRIYHFGYCQSLKIQQYKWGVSGHAPELRPGWMNEIYLRWSTEKQLTNLHPVSRDIWVHADPFDKNTLPEILHSHPNFNKEVVE